MKTCRFSMRSVFVAVAILCVVLAGYAWWQRRVVEPRRHALAIEAMLESLAERRPAEMTRGQWGSAVAWTLNLHGNSLLPFEADAPTLARFSARLKRRLAGRVDMRTIHWIWDEYAHLTPHGAQYQRFREMMTEEIAAIGPNEDPWTLGFK